MVQVFFKGQDNTRAVNILEAAQKRFGLFGFEKTTMKEIATDLNMSKGSLYYYFSDKEHLYKAIVCHEHEQYIQTIRSEISQSADPVIMLQRIVKTRQGLFRTLINLSRSRFDTSPAIHFFMKDTISTLRLQEKEIIHGILSTGVNRGIFAVSDLGETADLFLDILRGLRVTLFKEMTGFQMTNDDYEILIKRSSQFVDIFVKGIGVHSLKSNN
jgi:AcrR family transcriptional regulator